MSLWNYNQVMGLVVYKYHNLKQRVKMINTKNIPNVNQLNSYSALKKKRKSIGTNRTTTQLRVLLKEGIHRKRFKSIQ